MKFGIRTPSIKRSIRARTTGRLKRAAKRSVNPFYGKSGMGYINSPKKALYNTVYNKTSFGVADLLKPKSHTKMSAVDTATDDFFEEIYKINNSPLYTNLAILSFVVGVIVFVIGQFVLLFSDALIIKFIIFLPFIIGVVSLIKAIIEYNKNQQIVKEMSLKLSREITIETAENIKYEMEEHLEAVENSMQNLLCVGNVDAFFAEYRFIVYELKSAIEIESVFVFPNGKPSEILDNFQKNYTGITNEFIERMYEMKLDKIHSLKTEKAKKNNANKFKETFENYSEFMTQESVDKLTELYNLLSKECVIEP